MISLTKKVFVVSVLILLIAGIVSFTMPRKVSASISAGNSSNLDQLIYRWRFDNGSESAATWRALANTGITDISITETSLRLRFNIDVPTNRVQVSVQPRLEFSSNATSCTDGTWTTIGAQGSGLVFRLKASTFFTDGANTTQQLGADTHITGDIYESTQTGTSISVTGSSESTEVEWSIEANNAANNTVYRFRVSNNGTAFGSYSNCATLQTVSAATTSFTQNDFEWFVSADSVTLTDAWPSGSLDLAENEVFTQLPATKRPLVSGDQIRIQMNVTVGTANLGIGAQAFQLEYAAGEDCTTAVGWASVGAKGSGTIWRFFNTTLGDSATDVGQISTTSISEYYSETNPSPVNQNTVVIGESMEWDWPVENNGAAENTTYCFRMAKSGGTALDTYNSDGYPKLTTAPGTSVLMRHGNFFQNDSEKGFFWSN